MKNEKSVYRQRGFVCTECKVHTMMFGNDLAPVICPNCNCPSGMLVNLWDHQVTESVQVTDFPKTELV